MKEKRDLFTIERKVGTYRKDGGYWMSVQGEVRIRKNGKTILHLDKVEDSRPIKKILHEEFK